MSARGIRVLRLHAWVPGKSLVDLVMMVHQEGHPQMGRERTIRMLRVSVESGILALCTVIRQGLSSGENATIVLTKSGTIHRHLEDACRRTKLRRLGESLKNIMAGVAGELLEILDDPRVIAPVIEHDLRTRQYHLVGAIRKESGELVLHVFGQTAPVVVSPKKTRR